MGSFALRTLVMLGATLLGLVASYALISNLDWVDRAGGLQAGLERALIVLSVVVSLCWLAGVCLAACLPPLAHRRRDAILAGLLALALVAGGFFLRALAL
ncbi:hypothetical protein [Roseomonas sp. 18066]|uniref:hypothetical protein n=1 Tax=Roseomonas sp. 18066 TaxID=2681412 RepID=UPI00135BFF5E|nr:hypothetical protein [Roseomonas sp. 18066]